MKPSVPRLALAALLGMVAATHPLAATAQPDDCHGAPSAWRILLSVDNVRSNHGFVVANVYGDDPQRFLADNGRLSVWRDPAQRGTTPICFYVKAPGDYAVVAFHDANANGKLDLNFLGLPTEGYGFSNNVRPIMHAPPLQGVKFRVAAGDTRLHIRLRYPP